jgi:hypothetical protein
MMPPDGYSVRCVQEPDRIHRSVEGELRPYLNGQIASSWNVNWREELVNIDCDGIVMGTPMSMNFDALPIARTSVRSSPSPRVTASPDQNICEVLEQLPLRTYNDANNFDKDCEAAQWADTFFKAKFPMLMDKMSSRLQLGVQEELSAPGLPGISDPVVLTAACVAVESQCLLACVASMPYDLSCFPACEAAEAICYGSYQPTSPTLNDTKTVSFESISNLKSSFMNKTVMDNVTTNDFSADDSDIDCRKSPKDLKSDKLRSKKCRSRKKSWKKSWKSPKV